MPCFTARPPPMSGRLTGLLRKLVAESIAGFKIDLAQSADRKRGTDEQAATEIEIPKNATDQIFRMLLEDITKAIKTARAQRKDRITVTIRQE